MENMTPKEKELFNERAAILEFDAGVPRDLAERRARKEIRKMREVRND